MCRNVDRLPRAGSVIQVVGGTALEQRAAISESLCPWKADEKRIASADRYFKVTTDTNHSRRLQETIIIKFVLVEVAFVRRGGTRYPIRFALRTSVPALSICANKKLQVLCRKLKSHPIPFRRSRHVHNSLAAPAALPRIFLAPVFRFAPKRSRLRSNSPSTNARLPTAAPSVK